MLSVVDEKHKFNRFFFFSLHSNKQSIQIHSFIALKYQIVR